MSSTTTPTATHISAPTATPHQPESAIVITSGSHIRIRAPARTVFAAILDTPSYALWCRWSPTLTFASASHSLRVPGSLGTLHCQMGAGKFYDVPVKVLEVTDDTDADRDCYVLTWQGQMLPRWFGMAERVQSVQRVRSEDGGEECELRQWESMSGWGVYLLKWVMGVEAQLKEGNLMFAEDLKKWCESGMKTAGDS